MSEKIILEILRGLGLTERDSEVYMVLAKRGAILARDITKSFKINKAQVYRSLKNLQSRGLVQATLETPSSFIAIPFEKAVDMYIKIKKDEAQSIEQNRSAIIEQWRTIPIQSTSELPDRFMVIEGKNIIYSKVEEMVSKAKDVVLIANNSATIIESDLNGKLDKFFNKTVNTKLITEISKSNFQYMEKIFIQLPKNVFAKHIDVFGRFFPRFIVIDESELLFFTAGFDTNLKNTVDAGLWTNNRSLIHSFRTFFAQMWQNSIVLQEKIEEYKKNREPRQTKIIRDPEEGSRLFFSVFNQAEKEVQILATENDMPILLTVKEYFIALKNKGVTTKILIPITENNIKYVKELETFSKLTNIQNGYFRTVIVDRKHLFQFKTPLNYISDNHAYFESVLYTNEPEYVTGRANLLQDMSDQTSNSLNELRFNEKRYRLIFENISNAIILMEINGEAVTANKAACEMFGRTETELKKTNIANLMANGEKIHATLIECETKGHSETVLTYIRKDGTTFPAETTFKRFVDADNKTKICLIISDITEQKKAQENLLK